jgi:hypothetical protein
MNLRNFDRKDRGQLLIKSVFSTLRLEISLSINDTSIGTSS